MSDSSPSEDKAMNCASTNRQPAFLLPSSLPPQRHLRASYLSKNRVRTNRPLRKGNPLPARRPRHQVTVATAASSSSYSGSDATSSTSSTQPSGPGQPEEPTWRTEGDVDLLIPSSPSLILIFIGGLGASIAPRTTYSALLTRVCHATNAAIVAHRTLPGTDHLSLARKAATDIRPHLQELRRQHPHIATVCMGHSLGAKLALLSCTDSRARETLGKVQAGVLISFCNAGTGDGLPWGTRLAPAADALGGISSFLRGLDVSRMAANAEQTRGVVLGVVDAVRDSISGEFSPTPADTLAAAGARYCVPHTLVVRFQRDSIDDGEAVTRVLKSRCGDTGVVVRVLDGTHVTPMTPGLGDGFSSTGYDAVDDWVSDAGQNVTAELDALIAVVAAFLKIAAAAGA